MDFIYTYSDYQKQHQPDQALVGRMASLAMRQLQAALSQPYTGHEVAVTIPCLDPNLKMAARQVVALLKTEGDWNVTETTHVIAKNAAHATDPIKQLFKLDEPPLIGGQFYYLTLRIAL